MTRLLVAALLVGLVPAVAAAQPQPPAVARPTFSPYLNLLRRGSNPAVNYYGLVQPQVRFQQQFGLLQRQVDQNALTLQGLTSGLVYGEDPGFPATGHPAVFNSLGHYYFNSPAQGGGSGSAGRPVTNPYQGGGMAAGMFGPARPTAARGRR
jgi:hypothetical protein